MDKTLGNGLTQEIIRKIDRENRNIRLRRVGKRIQRITKRAMTEAVRFTALLVGESLFAFAIVPAMERQPERVLLIAEILAVLGFGIWLGSKIYEPARQGRRLSDGREGHEIYGYCEDCENKKTGGNCNHKER